MKNLLLLLSSIFFYPCHAEQTLNKEEVDKIVKEVLSESTNDKILQITKLSDNNKKLIHKAFASKFRPFLTDICKDDIKLEGHIAPVEFVSISPNNKLVFTTDRINNRLWDISKKSQISFQELDPLFRIKLAKFSNDGNYLLAGNAFGKVCLFNLKNLKKIQRIELPFLHTKDITSLAFSGNSKFAITGSSDNIAIVWDLSNLQQMKIVELQGHHGPVNSVALSYDGKLALTADSIKNSWLWDISNFNNGTSTNLNPETEVTDVAFTHDSQGFFCCMKSKETKSGYCSCKVKLNKNIIEVIDAQDLGLKFNDNSTFGYCYSDGMFIIVDLSKPLDQKILDEIDLNYRTPIFTAFNTELNPTLIVYNKGEIINKSYPLTSSALSDDGNLALVSWSNHVSLWDLSAQNLNLEQIILAAKLLKTYLDIINPNNSAAECNSPENIDKCNKAIDVMLQDSYNSSIFKALDSKIQDRILARVKK